MGNKSFDKKKSKGSNPRGRARNNRIANFNKKRSREKMQEEEEVKVNF